MKQNPNPQFISNKAAIKQFDLENYSPLADCDFEYVMIMDGDTHITEDLDDWCSKIYE